METTQEMCANCGEKIGRLETPRIYRGEIVCPRCSKRLSEDDGPQEPAASTLLASEPARVFDDLIAADGQPADEYRYGDILVTPSKLVIGTATYAMPNVTSVSGHTSVIESRRNPLGWWFFGIGMLLLIGAMSFISSSGYRGAADERTKGYILLPIAVIGVLIGLAVLGKKKPDTPIYHLVITANSGERRVLDILSPRHYAALKQRLDRALELQRQRR